MGMGKSISEVGVEDLVKAGVEIEEAKDFERQLKDAINDCDAGFDPKELWREVVARKLLKPSLPHGVHQLIYYSVYHNYDESIHGPPLYWFPTLIKNYQ